MYTNISVSPDGNYVMITKINKPFSYLVTYRRFPTSVDIYSSDARLISNLIDLPLIEELPKGFMSVRTGKRNFSWRADKPSTLTYVEALDGGDPSKDVKYRDEVFELNAPFADEGKTILKTINRFRGIDWGNNNFAIAYDYWWNTRNEKTYVFNPSNIDEKVKVIVDRNYQDNYSDPGYFISERNIYNRGVIKIYSGKAFLIGDGYTDNGQFPFVDEFDIKSLNKKRLYQSSYLDKYESIYDFNSEDNELFVRIESPIDFPNYFVKSLSENPWKRWDISMLA